MKKHPTLATIDLKPLTSAIRTNLDSSREIDGGYLNVLAQIIGVEKWASITHDQISDDVMETLAHAVATAWGLAGESKQAQDQYKWNVGRAVARVLSHFAVSVKCATQYRMSDSTSKTTPKFEPQFKCKTAVGFQVGLQITRVVKQGDILTDESDSEYDAILAQQALTLAERGAAAKHEKEVREQAEKLAAHLGEQTREQLRATQQELDETRASENRAKVSEHEKDGIISALRAEIKALKEAAIDAENTYGRMVASIQAAKTIKEVKAILPA